VSQKGLHQNRPGRVEDFTRPFVVSASAACFVLLFLVWAAYGMLGAVLLALLLHRLTGLLR
jgi:hypothetical protein